MPLHIQDIGDLLITERGAQGSQELPEIGVRFVGLPLDGFASGLRAPAPGFVG